VIAWAHGTTGIAPGCAPSVMAPFANVPALDRLIGESWIYVATDYAGLGTPGGHAYLVGEDAARAVLDAIRAARRLDGLAPDNRVVVWGHSQGGNSALWTGIRADDYAPDVNIVGVAALAPASDLPALFKSWQGTMFGKIVSSYLIHAYAAAYPDVGMSAYVAPRVRPLVGDIASRCVAGRAPLFSVMETKLLPSAGIFARDPASGPLGDRLRQNTPATTIAAPVLIAQGAADDLVPARLQYRYVAARCAAGQEIDYRLYPGRDHVSLVTGHSALDADLVAWSRERFAGSPAASNCKR
jgi:alpha-beta hydrolase superfamily lysophospholipase